MERIWKAQHGFWMADGGGEAVLERDFSCGCFPRTSQSNVTLRLRNDYAAI
jgi:hypothetical protein